MRKKYLLMSILYVNKKIEFFLLAVMIEIFTEFSKISNNIYKS
jgi:hypothetical protein